MIVTDYDREKAVEYARKWAFGRNPDYFNFDGVGGDCTNFISQCVYAGSGRMNYTPVTGWFYISSYVRTASWTGVEYFRNFLTSNNGYGPFGIETDIENILTGDVIQLGNEVGDFYHNLIVCGFRGGVPLVAAHTNDAFNRTLTSYGAARLRYIHIIGVRKD